MVFSQYNWKHTLFEYSAVKLFYVTKKKQQVPRKEADFIYKIQLVGEKTLKCEVLDKVSEAWPTETV